MTRKNLGSLAWISLVSVLGFHSAANAGMKVAFEVKNDPSKPGTTSEILVQDGGFKTGLLDTGHGKENAGYAMLKPNEDKIWYIKPSDKSAVYVDKEQMEKVKAKMQGLQKQLEKMSPDQRKMVEGMMGKHLPAGMLSGAKITHQPMNQSATVGSWHCDWYSTLVNDEKTAENCVAKPETLGFTSADLADLKKIQDRAKVFTDGLGSMVTQGIPSILSSDLPGLSITTKHFRGGQLVSTHEFKGVTHEAIPASAFEVPAGYQVKAMADQSPAFK
jgi:hypothetical protein